MNTVFLPSANLIQVAFGPKVAFGTLPHVLGLRGLTVLLAEGPHEGRDVVERPPDPVELKRVRVYGTPRRLGVAAYFVAAVGDDHPQVALGRGEAYGVPVDQHHTGASPHDVGRVRLAVRDDEFRRRVQMVGELVEGLQSAP